MKKFLIICLVLFVAGVGCKKTDIGGGGLCACSPVSEPPVVLVIKNSTGNDLLNEKTPGAYLKDKIALFRKSADGKETAITFTIRPPFNYANEKFDFNHILIDINALRQQENSAIYLKLGEGEPYELQLKINKETNKADHLLINQQEVDRDHTGIGKDLAIFYLTENT